MKSLTLTIDGMRCGGRAQTVKALIGAESGVRAAEVSYQKREARILYDPQRVTEEALVQAVERSGFRVPSRSA